MENAFNSSISAQEPTLPDWVHRCHSQSSIKNHISQYASIPSRNNYSFRIVHAFFHRLTENDGGILRRYQEQLNSTHGSLTDVSELTTTTDIFITSLHRYGKKLETYARTSHQGTIPPKKHEMLSLVDEKINNYKRRNLEYELMQHTSMQQPLIHDIIQFVSILKHGWSCNDSNLGSIYLRHAPSQKAGRDISIDTSNIGVTAQAIHFIFNSESNSHQANTNITHISKEKTENTNQVISVPFALFSSVAQRTLLTSQELNKILGGHINPLALTTLDETIYNHGFGGSDIHAYPSETHKAYQVEENLLHRIGIKSAHLQKKNIQLIHPESNVAHNLFVLHQPQLQDIALQLSNTLDTSILQNIDRYRQNILQGKQDIGHTYGFYIPNCLEYLTSEEAQKSITDALKSYIYTSLSDDLQSKIDRIRSLPKTQEYILQSLSLLDEIASNHFIKKLRNILERNKQTISTLDQANIVEEIECVAIEELKKYPPTSEEEYVDIFLYFLTISRGYRKSYGTFINNLRIAYYKNCIKELADDQHTFTKQDIHKYIDEKLTTQGSYVEQLKMPQKDKEVHMWIKSHMKKMGQAIEEKERKLGPYQKLIIAGDTGHGLGCFATTNLHSSFTTG